MPRQEVNLSEKQAEFIRRRLNDGLYRDTDDVIGAALRSLQLQENEDELKLAALRKLATEAFEQIDRGGFEAVDPAGIEQFVERCAGGRNPSIAR